VQVSKQVSKSLGVLVNTKWIYDYKN